MISSFLECKDLIREFHRCTVVIILLTFIGSANNNILVIFYKSLSFQYMYSIVYPSPQHVYILQLAFVLCGDIVYSTNGQVFSVSELSAHELVVMHILLFDDWGQRF